jgi:hypothetical protein
MIIPSFLIGGDGLCVIRMRAGVSDPPFGRFRHTPARALLQVLEGGCVAAERQLSSDNCTRSSVTSRLGAGLYRQ